MTSLFFEVEFLLFIDLTLTADKVDLTNGDDTSAVEEFVSEPEEKEHYEIFSSRSDMI